MFRIHPSVLVLCTVVVVGCSSGPQGDPIRIDGSSTVYLLGEEVAQAYQKSNRHAVVNLAFSGTRSGFERFCAGHTDIQNASHPITPDEDTLCGSKQVAYVELPIAFDGITLIVNPKNEWAKDITINELRELWQPAAEKKITRWKQIRADWPDREIHLFGPGTESGTFDYFTEVIVGKIDASRTDYTASGDDEAIVKGVESDELALGYVGYGYYLRHTDRLHALAVDDLKDDVGRGPVEPSTSNISRGTYRPLSRPLFIYVNAARLERPELKSFVQFYLREAGNLAEHAGSVALTGRAYELTRQRFAKAVTGTMYKAPDAANLSVEYLLNQ
jgi:phosphate transport system substrate-binding protein